VLTSQFVFTFGSEFIVRSSMFESSRVAEPRTANIEPGSEREHEPRPENPEM